MIVKKNKIILEKGEQLVRKCFVANYKVFYGDQTRNEYESMSAETEEEAEKEALIYEITSNTNYFAGKEETLMKKSINELINLCEKHKEDRCEYEVWDFRGLQDEKNILTTHFYDIEIEIRRKKK